MNRILAFPLALVLILMPLGPLTLGQQPSPNATEVAKVKAELARRSTGGEKFLRKKSLLHRGHRGDTERKNSN